ncbi:hypothetical protein CR164_07350 [Prosthecochloris marina]|uniref:Uncharacterized protein n=1 Tax=Prosthecochloris marina TaxID=2017681 RepID=A0A317T629_9CHLB|nr:hypothetical protein CR164_07350 [Prosthecochloris marina]
MSFSADHEPREAGNRFMEPFLHERSCRPVKWMFGYNRDVGSILAGEVDDGFWGQTRECQSEKVKVKRGCVLWIPGSRFACPRMTR